MEAFTAMLGTELKLTRSILFGTHELVSPVARIKCRQLMFLQTTDKWYSDVHIVKRLPDQFDSAVQQSEV